MPPPAAGMIWILCGVIVIDRRYDRKIEMTDMAGESPERIPSPDVIKILSAK